MSPALAAGDIGDKVIIFDLTSNLIVGGHKMEILKVSARSVPNSVAGAIAAIIKESGEVEIQAVGAGATNQAVKAVAIARGYLAPVGIDIVCIPAFANVVIDDDERTAIKLICEKRN